jgi:hypothetical protein
MKTDTRIIRNLAVTLGAALVITASSSLSQAQIVTRSENFEGGWGNWYSTMGVWEIGVPISGPPTNALGWRAHQGTNCAATVLSGDYPAWSTSRLVSPAFEVPAANPNPPRLRFWHWWSFAEYAYGRVQISTNNGTSWVNLSEDSNAGLYVGWSYGWWSRAWLDLTAYAGRTVQLGFYFAADGASVSSGWYVDELVVETGPPPPPPSWPESFEGGWGGWRVDYFGGQATDGAIWEIGVPTSGPPTNALGWRAHQGTNCAATVLSGDYPAWSTSRLVSPAFEVPVASLNPRLRFWHWWSFAEYAYGRVQISTNNGTSWDDLPNGTYTGVSTGWIYSPPLLDLSGYGGQTVQLGFYFGADGASVSSGWYVDEVLIETDPDDPPEVIQGPTSLVVTQGQSAAFLVMARGSWPLYYQWSFSNQWSLNYTNLTNGGRISGATSSALYINDVQPSDAGRYSVLVSNSVSTVSTNASLEVWAPPSITTPPQSQTNMRGSDVTFTVEASGFPALAYQWRFNGSNLTNGGPISGVTTPTLNIANVQTNDAGLYDVVVSNPVGVTNSAPAELRVLIVPLPWTNHDVGDVGRAGSASYSDGVFTVTGSGEDSEGTADAFHFVHQTLTGDGQIVARLLTLQGDDPAAEAGVMIRETLTPGSCHVLVAANSDKETVFRRRLITDDYSVQNLHQGTNYSWLRLMRMGDMFVGHVSTNGLDWEYAWFTTMNLTAQVEIGLAVTAHSFGALATAEFDNVIVTNLTPIPGPWLLPGPRIYLGGEGVTPASLHAQGGFKMLLGSEVDDQLEVLASPEIMTGGPPEHQVLDKTTFTSLGRVTNTLGVVPFLDTRALTNANPSFYLLRKVEP